MVALVKTAILSPEQGMKYCEINGCENTAHSLIKDYTGVPLLACAECMENVASMNSDNEEWLAASLRDATPFTGSAWTCTQCHKPSDSFHLFNGICYICRAELLYWPERATVIAEALARQEVTASMGRSERRRVALERACWVFVLASVCLVCHQENCVDPIFYLAEPRWLEQIGTCPVCRAHILTDAWCCCTCGTVFCEGKDSDDEMCSA